MLTDNDKKLLIQAAHEAQHDAGSLEWFARKTEERIQGGEVDPIVAVVASAIEQSDDLDEAYCHLNFYHLELMRAAAAVYKLANK